MNELTGKNCLHYAAYSSNFRVMQYLIVLVQAEADNELMTRALERKEKKHGCTPFQFCMQSYKNANTTNDFVRMCRYLTKKMKTIDEPTVELIFELCQQNEDVFLNVIKIVIKRFPHVFFYKLSHQANSLLHMCCKLNLKHVLIYLVEVYFTDLITEEQQTMDRDQTKTISNLLDQ